jgi:TPR repeat protein
VTIRFRPLIAIFTLAAALHASSGHAQSSAISDNLSIDLQVELLMTELTNLLKVDDNRRVVELIPKIRALDVAIPDSLYFLEARALYRTGNALDSRDRLIVYLAKTGRDGDYYDQAADLLLAVKEDAAIQERQKYEEERRSREEAKLLAEKASKLRIRESQEYLYQLGFSSAKGGDDLSRSTREAIAVYQVRRDLEISGEITDETLESLKSEVPEEHACDILAGYPRDSSEWGMPVDEISHRTAVPECNRALREYPDVVRFQIEYARALLKDDRNEDAMNALEDAARAGYPEAEYTIGLMHASGRLSEKGRPDYTNALRWYRLAADRDHARAIVAIGDMAADGKGDIKKSLEAAVEWYTTAAELDYPPAQVMLAGILQSGRGIDRDYDAAIEWLSLAADLDYPEAHYQMGQAYESGRGVTKDKYTARSWYRTAEELGHEEAGERLRRM